MLRGLFPPIPTPFQGGEVSADLLARNLARWNELPIDGYVVLGSNGEAPLLEDGERMALVKAAWDATPPDRALIVGAGRETTRATIRAVREAFDLQADAVLVGAPVYYKPAMTDDVLREHFLRVADASPGPVILYSVPFFTSLPIRPSLFADLLQHERIAGIKDSSGDVESLGAMLEAARASGREISVLIGNARLLAEGLRMGAAGAVLALANVAPTLCARISAQARQGRHAEAAQLSARLAPLSEAVTRRHGIAGLKAALDRLGFFGGDPRPPLLPLAAAARAEITALLDQIEPLP